VVVFQTRDNPLIWLLALTQWAKSPKKQSVGMYFEQHGTVFWVPN